jgi:hypothetical protein
MMTAYRIWHNVCVRRLLAISLLLLFGLPFALPLFGSNAAEGSVPACCRRGGKHHCAMISMLPSESSTRTVSEKCPYSIAQPAILVLPSFTPCTSASVFAGITPHPAVAPQVEAWLRISFDRTRQKRGPPLQTA